MNHVFTKAFEDWWLSEGIHIGRRQCFDPQDLALAAWNGRKLFDASICLEVDPPLSSDAAPEAFSRAIEGR